MVAQSVKNLPAMQKAQVRSLGREDPWRREWLPTPIFVPGEFHGQRSLVGHSPWGHKELDTIEQLTHFNIKIIIMLLLAVFHCCKYDLGLLRSV